MAGLWTAIVTPDRQVVRGQVDMVVAPSVSGEVTILPDHRPLLAKLQEGVVELRVGGSVDTYAVSGGFLEVQQNKVTILAETAEGAGEIDTKRSQAALKDAQAKLEKLDPVTEAYAEEMSRARRAEVRLRVAAH